MRYTVTVDGKRYDVDVERQAEGGARKPTMAVQKTESGGGEVISAPIPGKIINILSDGSSFSKGDTLAVIEAMKLENEVRAPFDGSVAGTAVSVGESVGQGAELLRVRRIDG